MRTWLAISVFSVTLLFQKANAQISYTKSSGMGFGEVLKFSTGGELLVSGSNNKIGLCVATTGQLSQSFLIEGAKDINDIDFLGTDTLAISNEGEDILLFDIKNATVASVLKGHTKKVTSIEINAESNRLYSSSLDHTTILWDLGSKNIMKRFNDHKGYVLATAINQSTGRLASCGADGMVNIYSPYGERIFSKKITKGWLWSIAFSADGNSIVAGGDSETYIISDLDTQKSSVMTLPQVKGKGYSTRFSPDGKYLAVGTIERYVYLFEWETKRMVVERRVDHGDVINLEFDPEGKSMVTSHSNYKGHLKWDLRSLNILPSRYLRNTQDKTPPQIYVSNPVRITDERVVVYADFIKLQGTVIDERGVFQLKVNSANVVVSDNGSFSLTLPLSFSETPVTIEARDVNQNVSLKRFTIVRKTTNGSDYDPATARNFLLVIGINDYLQWPKLYNARNDANGIAGTLSGLYNFNFSDVTILLDSQASRGNIYNTLRTYAEKVGPKDNFMVYFSGHGHFDKILNEGYWVPVDANKQSIGDLISNSDVLKIIKSINSQHTLIVADACFSGSLFMESGRGDFVDNVEKYKSRWGFTSGRLEVVSDGEVGKNSPFAQSLMEFFRRNTKEKISISEIIQYVKMKVPVDSKQTPIGNPLKNVGDEGGEFIFYKKN